MVDVSQHELVPDHVILEEPEIVSVLDEYGLSRTDLPKIKTNDPALPEGAAPGDVLKIVRNSRTAETSISYRLVIE
jgi:DNA-directed RNA polymerase subunit H